MTDHDLARLGPAFSTYLGRYRACFLQDRTAGHFDDYCRGLLSDLPRKTIEPIALARGTAVRTLQEFLVTASWDQSHARNLLQRQLARVLQDLPPDPLGTVGVLDETSCVKKGDKTPGVQRQYLGCVGKIENGIVTVHVGIAHGRFQALADADVYLPRSWDEDRERCQAAGIPDEVRYQPKWQIALDQVLRLHQNGLACNWLTMDEGYGSKVPFLTVLSLVGQKFVAEVPVNFSVRTRQAGPPEKANALLTVAEAKGGRRFRFRRETQANQWWRGASVTAWVDDRPVRLVVAINQATAEVKYFVTNAVDESLRRVLAVAFRRATVEHSFRLGKQEAGLMHYEGRNYTGLMRHLTLALVVMGFVSIHTDRLRGKKSERDAGASEPSVERAVCDVVSQTAGDARDKACGRGDPVSSEAQRASGSLTQKAAA